MEHLKIIEACPLCGHASFFSKGKFKDFMVSKEIFEIQECNKCQFLFTSPLPRNLGPYYESDQYLSHTEGVSSLFEGLYRFAKYFALRKKYKLVKSYLGAQNRMLDYGCGTGAFAGFVKSKGVNVMGVEPSETARNIAKEKYGFQALGIDELSEIDDHSIDVITLWHVLEHIENFHEILQELRKKLSKNGRLIIAVPNYESFDAKHYGHYWAAWDTPVHVSHFSKKTMGLTMKENGLQIQEILTMPFDSFYVSLLSESYKTGKKRWFSGLFIGLLSNIRGIYNKNTSSLIYVVENQ